MDTKSSDLNPIEMRWLVLDKKLETKPIYGTASLTDCLQEQWTGIDKDLCIKLIEPMPERIEVFKSERWTFSIKCSFVY